MIRNMQIRSKLIAVLVIPLVALTVLAALGIGAAVSRGVQADRSTTRRPSPSACRTWCTSCSASATCRPPGSGAAATPATAAWSPSGWRSTRRSTFRQDVRTSSNEDSAFRERVDAAVAELEKLTAQRELIANDEDMTSSGR